MGTERRVVIVGGVAAGMSAATRLRRLDETAHITVVERGSEVSVATCGMPYHLGGVIAERDDLVLQHPEAIARRFALDVRTRTTAIDIDRIARVVVVRGPSGMERLPYDDLVLATGAVAIRPQIPGAERTLALRGIDDLDRIAERLRDARRVVVLGGGYVGVEIAENLVVRGLEVALVQRAPHLLTGFDPEMVVGVAEAAIAAGVDLHLDSSAVSISLDEVVLASGERILADLVISAIGVRPESELARAAGLATGASGGVLVDEQFRTSDPAIRAVGDVAEKADAILGGTRSIPLAGPANLHGRLVADAIAGIPVSAAPTIGVAVVGAFGVTAAVAGASEAALRAAGREHRVIHTHPLHHAGYYPGARPIALKLLVDPSDDRILGAQAVGTAGVERRIDVIATAMRGGLRASELAQLELAYAPQFGSAKDPVAMLGYVADNRRSGERAIQWHELDEAVTQGARLIDVRAEGQLAEGLIPGAEWIPVEQLRARVDELRRGRVIVHCRVGQGAHTALRLLAAHGVDVANLDGGYLTWHAGTRARELAHEVTRV
ncbi:FAD-dependent oxidoreductase [Homoserinibacter sp. GY 40078]|uniref:FAD-dependent oxidoreductase n=1 Tax=Homoserinibacter sp. GY 40078 TaxID=2603275 RepID=UPI0011C73F6A|nr:FAD-dependent oxidoreductase [Homoserinibacter sp. GY 40078]TXK19656.1 CoA-disulfide reductase [Homoserinibacter sp. GY 40078]